MSPPPSPPPSPTPLPSPRCIYVRDEPPTRAYARDTIRTRDPVHGIDFPANYIHIHTRVLSRYVRHTLHTQTRIGGRKLIIAVSPYISLPSPFPRHRFHVKPATTIPPFHIYVRTYTRASAIDLSGRYAPEPMSLKLIKYT